MMTIPDSERARRYRRKLEDLLKAVEAYSKQATRENMERLDAEVGVVRTQLDAEARFEVRPDVQKFAGADWLESCGKTLSPFGAEVADILGQVFQGIYHIDSEVLHKRCQWDNERYIEVVMPDSTNCGLSTYDFNNLTTLVVLCHDRCVRLSIYAAAPNRLRLMFHKREGRTGSINEKHPTLEEAVRGIRERRGLGEVK
jgi:hypothetical protein